MVSFSKLAVGVLAVVLPAMAGAQAPGIEETRPTSTQPAEEKQEHVSADEGEFERPPEEGLVELAPEVWLDWHNGLILRSLDKKSQLRFGGLVMADLGWVDDHGLDEGGRLISRMPPGGGCRSTFRRESSRFCRIRLGSTRPSPITAWTRCGASALR
jgi:hypothetical protein